MIECLRCGHNPRYHYGVGPKGYGYPELSCRFETDRYEICTCDHLELDHDEALKYIVKVENLKTT